MQVTEAVTDLLHPTLTAQGSPSSAITLPSIFGQTFHKNTTHFFKNSIFPHSTPLILQFSKRETHIHDISNTYVTFPQLFAKGKSLKSEGIDMPRDKNKGLHGDLGHAIQSMISLSLVSADRESE
jgi:hypothetical protein